MYRETNPNPEHLLVGDCVIRALAVVLKRSWECVYADLALKGLEMHDMPSANRVWGEYLQSEGYRRFGIADKCPNCYTVSEFAHDHPFGTFILSTGTHVVAVIDGDYYDTWDSGSETPIFYWKKQPVGRKVNVQR